jgi:hypothetical protein
MAKFTFDRITPDGKIVILVDDNIHELTEDQVRKSQQKLADKLSQTRHLDTFEMAWAKAYELALHELKQRPRLRFAG